MFKHLGVLVLLLLLLVPAAVFPSGDGDIPEKPTPRLTDSGQPFGMPFESLFHQISSLQKGMNAISSLRERLGGGDEYSIDLAKNALKHIPHDDIIAMLKWSIYDFWERRNGWPDLLCTKSNSYKFIEVKSPRDKIQPEQFEWFNWAYQQGINCEVCTVNRIKL